MFSVLAIRTYSPGYQMVGPQGSTLAVAGNHNLFYSKRVLYVLGKLRFPHWCHHVYHPRSRSSSRLCTHVVRDVPPELGGDRLDALAMHSHWLNRDNIRSYHYSDWSSVRLLRGSRVHA